MKTSFVAVQWDKSARLDTEQRSGWLGSGSVNQTMKSGDRPWSLAYSFVNEKPPAEMNGR